MEVLLVKLVHRRAWAEELVARRAAVASAATVKNSD